MEWHVTYDMRGVTHIWNCSDSEVEAIRVFTYFKYISDHVCMFHNDEIVDEYTYYDEF